MKISNPRGLNNSPLITLDMLKQQLDALQKAFENILTGDEAIALSNNGYVPFNDKHKIDTNYYDTVKINKYEFSTSSMIASPGYTDDFSGNAYITLQKEVPGFVLKIEDISDRKNIITECEYTDDGKTNVYVSLAADSISATQPLSTYTFVAYSLLGAGNSPIIFPASSIILN